MQLVTFLFNTNPVNMDGGVVVGPSLSVPTSIALDGKSSGIVDSSNAVISWVGPTQSSVNAYVVFLADLVWAGSYYSRTIVAELRAAQTAIRVPSGYLVPGHRYVITVVARAAVGSLLGYDSQLPEQGAGAESQVFLIR